VPGCLFAHRQGFTGEQRLIELEVVAAQQAQISPQHLAALQLHGIAEHRLAIAQHQCRWRYRPAAGRAREWVQQASPQASSGASRRAQALISACIAQIAA
jgi:hypothetical protein